MEGLFAGRPKRAPATMNDEGLADASAANPFRLPRLYPGIDAATVSFHPEARVVGLSPRSLAAPPRLESLWLPRAMACSMLSRSSQAG